MVIEMQPYVFKHINFVGIIKQKKAFQQAYFFSKSCSVTTILYAKSSVR